MLLLLLCSLRLEEDQDLLQRLILQILRRPPPPDHPRRLGSRSFPRFFRHLYLNDGILTDFQEIEESAPPFLRHPSGETTVAAMKVVLDYESSTAARRLGGVYQATYT